MVEAAERTVLVVLRQGSATPHGETNPTKEVVQGVASWRINASENLELVDKDSKLIATFRDWSFVKFMADK